MIPNFLYDWAPFFANLFSSGFAQKFSGHSGFFKTVQFWQRYANEFKFRGKSALLKDLSWEFPIRNPPVFPLEVYFLERHNFRIYSVNGKILMEIGELRFVLPFPFGVYELSETWRGESCGSFDLTDELVVDVGAFIGDTALYFANKGAKKVIGFEPANQLYKVALENVELNNCGDKIELRNVAVGAINGITTFMFDLSWPGASSTVYAGSNSVVYNTDVVSLASIVEEVGHIGLLKMDCEGAEHKIISHAYKENLLKDIDHIAMEIHGSPSQISSLLRKARFKIELSEHFPARWMLAASKNSEFQRKVSQQALEARTL
jgi:FkbM family methyltransferase